MRRVRYDTHRASSLIVACRKPSTRTTSTSPLSNGMDREDEEYAGEVPTEAREPLSGVVRDDVVEDLLMGTPPGLYLPRDEAGAISGPSVGDMELCLNRDTMRASRRRLRSLL